MSKKINRATPILVTGGTGYLASWIIKLLLDEGLCVRATVRDKSNMEKNKHLIKLGDENKGSLELFEADLLEDGTFDKAMNDCELVFHTASPFKILGIKNPQKELIDPALKGTNNVLYSVNKTSSVKRVVMTSSTAAIYGDASETTNKPLDEKSWNTTSSIKNMPYLFSKRLAEEKAWEIVKSQNRWDLITMNPGQINGPSLSKRTDSTSIDFMLSMLNGKYKYGLPDLTYPLVDVRDVAKAHLLGAFTPNASGRHILAVDNPLSYLEIAKTLKDVYGDKYPVPTRNVPNIIMYLIAPFMKIKWSYLKNNLGIKPQVDNSYGKKDLDIRYMSAKKTILDHAEQIINDGLI